MGKKRILVSINTSWNIYNFRLNLIRFLKDRGFDIIACAPKDAFTEKLIEEGIEFHSLRMSQKGTNPADDIQLIRQYRNIFKTARPDLCLFYTIKPNIYGSLAAGSLGIPFLNTITGLGTVFIRDRLSSKIARNLYRIALQKSSGVFFQNSDDQNVFLSKKLVKADLSNLIPGSGIDTEYFRPIPKSGDRESFTFLMVSRLIFDKGIREFIEAAGIMKKKYPHARFEIVGKAEEEASLGFSEQEMVNLTKNTNIIWHGPKDDVRPFLSNSDVVVLPSYREGMSRALLEACSMQKPIIATDVPGCRELVNEEKNGLLTKPADAVDLSEKMVMMIEKPDSELLKMGENAREMVRSVYAQELIFKSYLNAITDKLG